MPPIDPTDTDDPGVAAIQAEADRLREARLKMQRTAETPDQVKRERDRLQEENTQLREQIAVMAEDLQWFSLMGAGVNLLDEAGRDVDRAGVEWIDGREMPFRGWIGNENKKWATGEGHTLGQAAYATSFAAKCAAEAAEEEPDA